MCSKCALVKAVGLGEFISFMAVPLLALGGVRVGCVHNLGSWTVLVLWALKPLRFRFSFEGVFFCVLFWLRLFNKAWMQ